MGAGFAGLYAAKGLRDASVEVLLIDKENYHTFQPLLYQVATAGLEASEIARSVRAIFQGQKNLDFRQGLVTRVNWERKHLLLADSSEISFDYLILAAGTVYQDFGISGVKEYGFYLKSLQDALSIRHHLLSLFEEANLKPKKLEEGFLDVAIVGGGPTGVEMAGALAELYKVLARDFPRLDLTKSKIWLIEQAPHLLTPYSKASQDFALKRLEALGIGIRLNASVQAAEADGLWLREGAHHSKLPAHTLIWAAGVRAHPLAEALGLKLDKGFRVVVKDDLSLPDKPFAFVAGDMAAAKTAKGEMLAQLCPVAIQAGIHVAKQIERQLQEKPMQAFHYFDKGIMAIVGRNAGITEASAQLGGFKLRGFLGWLAWLFIHLIYLVGYQNRLQVLLNWCYNYLSHDRHVRLIMAKPDRGNPEGGNQLLQI
ncbi:MAG: NAD(P)/FAD-dependent oxidoreductase [Deinococcales bacterium]